MKKIIFPAVFLVILVTNKASAQYGFQMSYIGLSGTYAYIFKPAAGFELNFKTGDIDSRVRGSFSIGYYNMLPTQDTFSSYTIRGGSGTTLLPGNYTVKNYSVVPIGFGVEYHPFDSKLSPYIGLDGYFYVIDYSYHEYYYSFIDEDNEETLWQVGIVPKIGLSYKINDNWLISAGIGLSIGITGTADTQSYTKTFLNISYYVD
jgi:hypothetical protein